MTYRQYPVHPALQPWLRYCRSCDVYTDSSETLHIRSFPSLYPRLIFQDTDSASCITEKDGNTIPIPYLSGMDTIPTHTYWESRFSHLGVRFHPYGLYAILGIPATEPVDQTPDIELLEKKQLTNLLIAAGSHEQRAAVVQSYSDRKRRQRRQDPFNSGLFASFFTTIVAQEPKPDSFACNHRYPIVSGKFVFLPFHALGTLAVFGHIASIHARNMTKNLCCLYPAQQAKLILIAGINITQSSMLSLKGWEARRSLITIYFNSTPRSHYKYELLNIRRDRRHRQICS